ncbi:MAG: hypothetical protein LBR86_08590 [Tannerella sp.]|nr:hypothetical protein [Tannerella sp.]
MLTADIRRSSSLTEADVKGVLTALVHAMRDRQTQKGLLFQISPL